MFTLSFLVLLLFLVSRQCHLHKLLMKYAHSQTLIKFCLSNFFLIFSIMKLQSISLSQSWYYSKFSVILLPILIFSSALFKHTSNKLASFLGMTNLIKVSLIRLTLWILLYVIWKSMKRKWTFVKHYGWKTNFQIFVFNKTGCLL